MTPNEHAGILVGIFPIVAVYSIAPSLNPTLVVEDKRSTQVSWVGLWPDPPFEWVSESTYSVECSLVACVMCSFRACLVCSFKACLVCSFRDCLVCSFRACLVCSFRASGSLRFARSAPENPLSGFGGWGGRCPPLKAGAMVCAPRFAAQDAPERRSWSGVHSHALRCILWWGYMANHGTLYYRIITWPLVEGYFHCHI